MTKSILVGKGREIEEMSRTTWEHQLARVPERMETRLAFMTDEHHAVRYFVVRELVREGRPLDAAFVADRLELSESRVGEILDELERNLFFLVRNENGAVSWAFPVTVDRTPHRLSFSTGERLYGAWAEDSVVAPFVQGRLLRQELSVTIDTACEHCGRSLRLTVDSDLGYEIHSDGAEPLVFEPHVDWTALTAPNIIGFYWRNSVFFWSEEHAREHRHEHGGIAGAYLTLEQMAIVTPVSQGGLFAFG